MEECFSEKNTFIGRSVRKRVIDVILSILSIVVIVFVIKGYKATKTLELFWGSDLYNYDLYIDDAALNSYLEPVHYRYVDDIEVKKQIVALCRKTERIGSSSSNAYTVGVYFDYSAVFVNEKYLISLSFTGLYQPNTVTISLTENRDAIEDIIPLDVGIYSLDEKTYTELYDLISSYKDGDIYTEIPFS